MTDKERILLAAVALLAKPDFRMNPDDQKDGSVWVDWRTEKLEVGDLVVGMTGICGGVHPYLVGWIHEIRTDYDFVIREIGSNRLCNYSNERFYAIRGIPQRFLYEGHQQSFYEKVLKAFKRGGDWGHRFGGLTFKDGIATITIRYAFGYRPSFNVDIPWGKRTTIKAILAAMVEAGYGKTEEHEAEKEHSILSYQG